MAPEVCLQEREGQGQQHVSHSLGWSEWACVLGEGLGLEDLFSLVRGGFQNYFFMKRGVL